MRAAGFLAIGSTVRRFAAMLALFVAVGPCGCTDPGASASEKPTETCDAEPQVAPGDDASLMQTVELDEYCEGHARDYLQWVDAIDEAVESNAGAFGNGWPFSRLLDADEELYGSLKLRLVQSASGDTLAAIESAYGPSELEAWEQAELPSIEEGLRQYLSAFVGLDRIEDEECREKAEAQIARTASEFARSR